MLPLWVWVVAASALAAPAPGTQEQKLQVAQRPNVVLVASDSFVSRGRTAKGRRPQPAESPQGERTLGLRAPACAHLQSNSKKALAILLPQPL